MNTSNFLRNGDHPLVDSNINANNLDKELPTKYGDMFKNSAGFNKTDTIDIINQESSEHENKTGVDPEGIEEREHLYKTGSYEQSEKGQLPLNLQLRQSSIDNQNLQAKIVSLEHTIESLQNELKIAKDEKRKKESQLTQFENRLADLTKQVTQITTDLSEKRSKISELESEIFKRDKMLIEKNSTSLNLKEMTEQALKATSEKVEQLENKIKKQRTKRREFAKVNKELEMKLTVTKDELQMARSQVLDLQAIRKQGTDGLMSEYSENLALRERM